MALGQRKRRMNTTLMAYGCFDNVGKRTREEMERKNSFLNLSAMLLQEESGSYGYDANRKNYVATTDAKLITDDWRNSICKWCFDIVDQLDFDRELVLIALNYMDRFLSKSTKFSLEESNNTVTKSSPSSSQYQLLAITSLYMAIKIHGDSRMLSINQVAQISRGGFTTKSIEAMERNILNTLEWRLNPPTTLRFVVSMIRLMPSWSDDNVDDAIINDKSLKSRSRIIRSVFEMSRYLLELSLCVPTLLQYKQSTIAYAAMFCALQAANNNADPLPNNIRIGLLGNIAEATGIVPDMKDVCQVREMLLELHPSIDDGCQKRDIVGNLKRDWNSINITEYKNTSFDIESMSPTGVPDECTVNQRKRLCTEQLNM